MHICIRTCIHTYSCVHTTMKSHKHAYSIVCMFYAFTCVCVCTHVHIYWYVGVCSVYTYCVCSFVHVMSIYVYTCMCSLYINKYILRHICASVYRCVYVCFTNSAEKMYCIYLNRSPGIYFLYLI